MSVSLPNEWFALKPHAQQSRLWRSSARFKAVAAGRGSGKTEVARRYLVRMLKVNKPWPDPTYLYCLPTFAQAKRVAWQKLKALVPREWRAGQPNESELTIRTIFGSTLIVVGMDKPQRVEGNQYDGVIVDESSDQKPGMFDLTLRPTLTHRRGFAWRIGVPKRAGVGAAEFKEYFFKELDDKESFTWPSEDILTPEEIANARESMDEKDYNEQFRASWESLAGLVFYSFSDMHNVNDKLRYHPNMPLLIGSDFNVDPMAWIIAQAHGNELHVIDELYIRNTNTQEALERLYKAYGSHGAGFRFFGDAAGRHRHSSASFSDYAQIRSDARFSDARVMYPLSNPAIADRFAATNALFCNANKVRRCFVHPRCKNLIKDLTHRSYKPGESIPDDVGDIGHITDALGYLIYMLYPFKIVSTGKMPEVYA
jgi:hypothetical protein